jgi:hypothetical protein
MNAKILLVVALILWVLWEGDGDPLAGIDIAVNEIQRGKRLTHAPYDKADGVVHRDPQELADEAADGDLDVYALARMVSSEEGRSSNQIKVAVCWAVKNHAARSGRSIASILLRANNAAHSGYFGTQKDIDPNSAGFGNSDRYASTANDPYTGDYEIAISVIRDTIPDPTGGADQFDRPKAEKDPVRVAQNRVNAGSVPAPVAGIDPDELRFWRVG